MFLILRKSIQEVREILLYPVTRCCKNCFQKIVYKTAQTIEYFIGNKVAGKIVKPEPVLDMNSRNFEEIVIPPEKKQEISNELR